VLRPPGIDVARTVLAEVFGYADFRAGQREAVTATVEGRDALVLLPTGSGKSLCYQVPALVARRNGRGATIVISPLIALMHDQVTALCGRGVAAAALHSHQDAGEQAVAIAALRRGALDLVYVSPERAAQPGFRRLLRQVRVALLAVDEAHCVSQWGHDFRPDYLRLRELREVVDAPMTALTATATPQVMDEIATHLGLRDPAIVRGDFSRPNLSFSVIHERSQEARLTVLRDAIDRAQLRSSAGKIGRGRALIYCSTRKVTETVAKALRARGMAAGHYHAGRTKLARERAHRAFALGRTPILVATNAFGMGIDFPDVRLIVHFQTPGSLEAYYQEAGRAGRDGAPAACLMMFGPGDLATQRRLAMTGAGSAALVRRCDVALAAVGRYASEPRCRQRALCAHFTGTEDHPLCGRCDVCVSPASVGDRRERAAVAVPAVGPLDDAAHDVIVAAVAGLRRPVGKTALAKALRGSRARFLARGGLLQLPQCGALSVHTEASIVAAIEELIVRGILVRTGRKYPTVWLAGRPVRGEKARGKDGGAASSSRRAVARGRAGPVMWALEKYRQRMARTLRWKLYMVFQRRVIVAIDRERPTSHSALARVPGLGPAKIERFGDDIIDLVRRHGNDQPTA
jgi:ATP-dependent DNA helicase RecQ